MHGPYLSIKKTNHLCLFTCTHFSVQVGKKLLDFPNHGVSAPLSHTPGTSQVTPSTGVYLVETVRVPAFSEMEVMATARVSEPKGDWILEGEPREKVPVMAARAVVSPDAGILPVRLLNPGAEPATVYEGTQIAHLETVGDSDVLDPASVATVQPCY